MSGWRASGGGERSWRIAARAQAVSARAGSRRRPGRRAARDSPVIPGIFARGSPSSGCATGRRLDARACPSRHAGFPRNPEPSTTLDRFPVAPLLTAHHRACRPGSPPAATACRNARMPAAPAPLISWAECVTENTCGRGGVTACRVDTGTERRRPHHGDDPYTSEGNSRKPARPHGNDSLKREGKVTRAAARSWTHGG